MIRFVSAIATATMVILAAVVVADEKHERPNRLVETDWLEANLDRENIVILDLRPTSEYNGGHIARSLNFASMSLRGNVGGLPGMLLPAHLLAGHMSLLGITRDHKVVLVADDFKEATIAVMALDRLEHERYVVLNGGFAKWKAEERPTTTQLRHVEATEYPVTQAKDDFNVDAATVLQHLRDGNAVIIDARSKAYFTGERSEEARPGHIPGSVNRHYALDLETREGYRLLKYSETIAQAYFELIPTKDTTVIIYCRTCVQTSHTYFVLKHLLNYKRVLVYGAGWTEWSARPELPVAQADGR